MSGIPDMLGEIAALTGRFKEKEAVLRASLHALSERLVAASAGTALTFSTETLTLDTYAPDGAVYGHISLDEDGIRIAYRSTDDDLDALDGRDDQSFHVQNIDACPLAWLRSLVEQDAFTKLMRNIIDQITAKSSDMEAGTKAILALTQDPSLSISDSFEHTAQLLGYERAIADWKDAQAAIRPDPEGAIRQACVLVETVCKHVLSDMARPLPADESIAPLWKAVSTALRLDPAEEAEPVLRRVCGGLFTVVQSIGALRTGFGDAHGKDPTYQPLAVGHARLAVNAAGCVATFIMERWQVEKGKID